MLLRMRTVALTNMLATLAIPATAADLNFCWIGNGGYTMTGQMQIPDLKMTNAILTEADVTSFKIVGYQDGTPIGSWNMNNRSEATTWHLRFDPIAMQFLTGGSFASTRSQGWNADGNVKNCGSPGFGFNSGNYAQDICVNGTYIRESSIPPETPFFATTAQVDPSCGRNVPLGKRKIANQRVDAESPLP